MKVNGKHCLLMVLAVGFLFGSCQKDKINKKGGGSTNSYTYQNGGDPQTIDITRASYSLDGDAMVLLFYSNSAQDGIMIGLENDNASFTGIEEGTFTHTGTDGIYFSGAVLYYNNGDESYSVNSIARKLIVSKDGGNYKISFEFTSGAGLVQGNYSGPVTEE